MAEPATHDAEHRITVKAPAQAVFDLISDVTRWPYLFPPTVHAERIEHDGDTERIRLWALANDEVKSWTSRRCLDRDALTVAFRQDVTQPPAAAMGGKWILEPQSATETLVVLEHDFQALDDDPDGVRWIERALDRNSRAELHRIKHAAELSADLDALTLSFADTLRIRGTVPDVYRFLHEADRWPQRLPHVARLELHEAVRNIQRMEMDTRTADGSTHTTKSVRVCFPDHRIVYKQTELPPLMAGHTGEWVLAAEGDTVLATARHTVLLARDKVTEVLGAGSTIDRARTAVHAALSRNSTTTLEHARAFAERHHG